ncbi:MAG: molybdopterin-synthase adenylyltransferase MoeB [Chloroflexi bacterium]|nr:molybdopterin-synthase adenylyltransferase MoeB [Chloroflexota bacterium]
MRSLNPEEIKRYQRHLCIPEFGEMGQQKLKKAAVLVVGAGGLGSAVLYYLAAAGVGRLGIMDADVIELSNLQRQILHDSEHLGMKKTDSAFIRLRALNPDIKINLYPMRFNKDNGDELIQDYTIVMDGTDNFETRFVINDACVRNRKIYIYGAINQFHGQVSVFDARKGPCFRCLYPEMPPDEMIVLSSGVGVVGAVPGIIGSIEALECIKILSGIGNPLYGRMILLDGVAMDFREIQIRKRADCPICSKQ